MSNLSMDTKSGTSEDRTPFPMSSIADRPSHRHRTFFATTWNLEHPCESQIAPTTWCKWSPYNPSSCDLNTDWLSLTIVKFSWSRLECHSSTSCWRSTASNAVPKNNQEITLIRRFQVANRFWEQQFEKLGYWRSAGTGKGATEHRTTGVHAHLPGLGLWANRCYKPKPRTPTIIIISPLSSDNCGETSEATQEVMTSTKRSVNELSRRHKRITDCIRKNTNAYKISKNVAYNFHQ